MVNCIFEKHVCPMPTLNLYLRLLLLLAIQPVLAQVAGCTDPLSNNYNPNATVNNGSCTYGSASINPEYSVVLPAAVEETSGLIKWQDTLYTHNDDTDTHLYAIDSLSGTVLQTLQLQGVVNTDWEEISQDDAYVYIGDFGNNVIGNRTNLKILRADKQGLLNGTATIDTINFAYSNQTDFSPKPNNTTDFDCEAFVVAQDSIYLFTKQWLSEGTAVYSLPKVPGTYTAQLKNTYNVSGLITGATYQQDDNLLVLCGYSNMLKPFVHLLYDFTGHDFFNGNKRKVTISANFHQMEGITSAGGSSFYLTNEHFHSPPFINVQQKLHKINLTAYLGNYLENIPLTTLQNNVRSKIRVYPNPAGRTLIIEVDPSLTGVQYTIVDASGRQVLNGPLPKPLNKINVGSLNTGVYTILLTNFPEYSYRFFKK